MAAVRVLLVSLALLVCACARAATNDWSPIVSPYGELFPALLLATQSGHPAPASAAATLVGDPGGLIGIATRARRAGESVHVTVRVPELGAEGELDATLADPDALYSLFPAIRWDRDRLAGVAAPRFARIEIELSRDGADAGRYRGAHKLHAAAEAPYFLDDGDGSADLSWIFAAFVDEHDPSVARLIDQALALNVVERFDGYALRDDAAVYRQLYALWAALESRGIRYSALTRSASVRGKVWVQNVRTIDASLTDRAANCVDGSVLIASLTRAAGLDAALVLVPGHMFLRVALDRDATRFVYLETTLINDARVRRTPAPLDLPAPDAKWARTRDRFSAALAAGQAQYRRYADALARADRPEYRIVDIAAARRLGVLSIADL